MKVSEIEITYTHQAKTAGVVKTSDDLYKVFLGAFPKNRIALKEYVYAAYLRADAGVLCVMKVSEGAINESLFDVRGIMQAALKVNAVGVAVCHNHPSGNMKPSGMDIKATKRIKEACSIMGLNFIDHLIISPVRGKYYSFAENNA